MLVVLAMHCLLCHLAYSFSVNSPRCTTVHSRAHCHTANKPRSFLTRFPAVTSELTITEKRSFSSFLKAILERNSRLESLHAVLCAVAHSCRDINGFTRRSATTSLGGFHSLRTMVTGNEERTVSMNVQGEQQYEMDIVANQLMKAALCHTGRVNIVASEEDAFATPCDAALHNTCPINGEYAVVFDPLDGSSNLYAGLPTGTIFGIYRSDSSSGADVSTILQSGSDMVAAGYCLYSAATHLIVTVKGQGVHMFTLDDVSGEFILSKPNVRIPNHGSIFSFNEAYSSQWPLAIQSFLRDLKGNKLPLSDSTNLPQKQKWTARYMGALVADVHNILLNGGIFGYPATFSSIGAANNGKLRLLYEANPVAMLIEAAGGAASDGKQPILQKKINDIHERTPLFIGSAPLVSSVDNYVLLHHNQ